MGTVFTASPMWNHTRSGCAENGAGTLLSEMWWLRFWTQWVGPRLHRTQTTIYDTPSNDDDDDRILARLPSWMPLSVCLSAVCLSVCVSVCLSVCLPICLSDRPRPFVCIVVSIMSIWGHPSFASLTLSRFVSVFVPLPLSVSPGLRIYAFVRLCVRLSICRRRFVFILNKETCSLLRTVSPYFMYS